VLKYLKFMFKNVQTKLSEKQFLVFSNVPMLLNGLYKFMEYQLDIVILIITDQFSTNNKMANKDFMKVILHFFTLAWMVSTPCPPFFSCSFICFDSSSIFVTLNRGMELFKKLFSVFLLKMWKTFLGTKNYGFC